MTPIRDIPAMIQEVAAVITWVIVLGFAMALMFVSTTPGMVQW